MILEVLDARDPLGCRCEDIERRILTQSPEKKIVYVKIIISVIHHFIISSINRKVCVEQNRSCAARERRTVADLSASLSSSDCIQMHDTTTTHTIQTNDCCGIIYILLLVIYFFDRF